MTFFKQAYGTEQLLVISLASLASAAGRISTQLDQDTLNGRFGTRGQVTFTTKTGGTAPTVGGLIEVYLVRGGRQDGSVVDDTLGLVDAAVAARSDLLELVGTIQVPNTANFVLSKTFEVEFFPLHFSLFVWNGTDQALSTTAGDHTMHHSPIFDEIV